jgi:hypothetical protein
MKQKDFVKQAILFCMTEGLTGEALISSATERVKQGLMSGECEHGNESIRTDEKDAKTYAKAVVNNYLKKDKELNGGVKYEPKTKRGPIVKDPELKELKKVLKALEANNADPTLIGQVQERITAKEAEIEAGKAKDKLPSLEDAMATLAKLGIGA